MSINYDEFKVNRLHKTKISKLSEVNANDIVKIDRSAVENYHKELMEKLYFDGYVAIKHLEEAITIVQNNISKLVQPHMESRGYTVDKKGCKVPNPSVMVDPDGTKRHSLEETLLNLQSKLSDAQSADEDLDFMKLVEYEIYHINYSLDQVNNEISNFVFKNNRKIDTLNDEKNRYIEHAIKVLEEFEMTRYQYKYRNTNQLLHVLPAKHKDLGFNTSTNSSNYSEHNIKSAQQDIKGNVYKEYYQNEIYIIEVITLNHLDGLIKKLKSETPKKPVLYIKDSEIAKLTTVEKMEEQMKKINYIIKKDKSGFFRKTIYGHIIFFENNTNGV